MISTKPILQKLLFEKMLKLPELINMVIMTYAALNKFKQKLLPYVVKSDHHQITILVYLAL